MKTYGDVPKFLKDLVDYMGGSVTNSYVVGGFCQDRDTMSKDIDVLMYGPDLFIMMRIAKYYAESFGYSVEKIEGYGDTGEDGNYDMILKLRRDLEEIDLLIIQDKCKEVMGFMTEYFPLTVQMKCIVLKCNLHPVGQSLEYDDSYEWIGCNAGVKEDSLAVIKYSKYYPDATFYPMDKEISGWL